MLYDEWKFVPITYFSRPLGNIHYSEMLGIKASLYTSLSENNNSFSAWFGSVEEIPLNVFNNLSQFVYDQIHRDRTIALPALSDAVVLRPISCYLNSNNVFVPILGELEDVVDLAKDLIGLDTLVFDAKFKSLVGTQITYFNQTEDAFMNATRPLDDISR
jgi:hypothetical protein